MNVTVKEKKTKKDVDFSVSQLLIYKRTSGSLVVLSNGKHTETAFEGIVINESDPNYRYINDHLSFSDKFAKHLFEKFNGTITIEQ